MTNEKVAQMSAALLVCAVSVMGCKKPAEQASMDTDRQVNEQSQTARSPEESSEDAGHTHAHGEHDGAHHHHRFDEPEKYAERWNDPARDVWQKPGEIVAAMGLSAGDVAVDIGAGTGYMLPHLSSAVGEKGQVMALDVEEEMVKYIAARKGEFGPATILPRKVSDDSPALKPESVHGVMTLNTWHHVAGRDAYAKKVYEGLKPGGKFVIVDYELDADPGPPKEMRLAPEAIIAELEGAGFEVELATEEMPRHYMIVGRKQAE